MESSGSYDYSSLSVISNQQEEDESAVQKASEQAKNPYREQDIYLPIANVARIMKNAVPPNGKIAKDAKECVQECVSEFISFITSEASERCAQEKRKTINGEDILFAMGTLGFDPYISPLKVYLQKYRDTLKAEKSGAFCDPSDSSFIPDTEDSDVVDPFGPPQFPELLVSSEQSSTVFNNQTSNLDQHIQFS